MRKIAVWLVIAVVGLVVLKKTSFFSYAGTLWSQVRKGAKEQVPTKFEIDRVRHEITHMDKDINNMIRPIAEHMATIKRLKKDIGGLRASLSEQKQTLLTMTGDLEGNPTRVVYGGEEYTAERVRNKLQRDFDSYKRCEINLKSQEKLLEAKERSLAATREQLAKLISKKREYEVRLAQLEADEETLQIVRLGNPVQIDDSRATEIEAALNYIEQRHDVQRSELELRSGPLASDLIPVHSRPRNTTVDLSEIRNHLSASAPAAETSTASGQ
jgi:chromosome segregation ATPase